MTETRKPIKLKKKNRLELSRNFPKPEITGKGNIHGPAHLLSNLCGRGTRFLANGRHGRQIGFVPMGRKAVAD